jgi:hypothetical protein
MGKRFSAALDPLGIVSEIFRGFVWCVGTVFEGGRALFRIARWLAHRNARAKEILWCPRGHQVPVYGVYECACGSFHEGWAFGRCRICGQGAGWTPCLVCGLPVQDPRR